MLVILSGVESIHKRLIARQIISKMNTFNFDNYNVDFSTDPFTILNENGDVLRRQEFFQIGDTDKQIETFVKMQMLEEKIFQRGGKENHFYNIYTTPGFDFKIHDIPDYKLPDYKFETDYDISKEGLIKRYKESDLKYFVITGSFSKTFIDELKNDLGRSNVIAINIIRNPSIVYFLHQKNAEYYNKQNGVYTKTFDDEKMYSSLINSIAILKDPTIQTIKFEDMINSEKFFIDDKNVGLYLDYNSKNGILTNYEYNNLVPNKVIKAQDVDKANILMSNFNFENLGVSNTVVTTNIFESLGYEPLTYKEIISGKFKKV